MVGFTVFYFALVLLLYVRSKSVVANELISFGNTVFIGAEEAA